MPEAGDQETLTALPATSAVDLPLADAAAWRQKFEDWWAAAKALQ